MIKAFVNGEYRELPDGATVESLVSEITDSRHGVAVAELLAGGSLPEELAPLSPARFAGHRHEVRA